MKFDEKYWKEKFDRLQHDANWMERCVDKSRKCAEKYKKRAKCLEQRLCDADSEIAAMNQQFDELQRERDTLEEQVEALTWRLEKHMETQKIKDAKNTALLQAIRAMAQGYAVGAADNM